MSSTRQTTPLSDSPWLWAYLFGAAALVALALATGKYGARQGQIERQFLGRAGISTAIPAGDFRDVTGPANPTTKRLVPLEPLFLVLAFGTAAAALFLWRTRTVGRTAVTAPSQETGDDVAL